MPGIDAAAAGERVERLLAELGALSDRAAREKAEELVRVLVELYGAALERVMEIVTEAGQAETLARLAGDDLVSSLLVVHDLHPLSTEERVRAALENVRPYLGSHAGDVELVSVEDSGVVRLRLAGTCHGCPSSRVTVTTAIERAIARAAPEVDRVEVDGVAEFDGLYQIQTRPPPGPCPVPEGVGP
ncbi:NifU family protein [Thermoactinospora rubra]|uniref:NifU family protein n=1 Tax=Thermoactinospora rubra TaxID=1088767 RepID=UPI001F0B39D2|nr:NifU family protein [Thermoactinospora rubra]